MKRGGPLQRKTELKRSTPLKAGKPWVAKGSPLERSKKALKRTAMPRKKTERQKEFDRELAEITPFVMERSGGFCEVGCTGICQLRAVHRHHRRRRNVNHDGKRNYASNILMCCDACHSRIHAYPAWARVRGFILSPEQDPDLIPVRKLGK